MFKKREVLNLFFFGSEYNIVKNPTLPPMSGRKHSEETKTIMSDRKHSEETKKTKISDAAKGRPKPEGSGRASQAIEVFDLELKTTTYYDSIREAGRALNIDESSIRYHLKSNNKKPCKKIYMFAGLVL